MAAQNYNRDWPVAAAALTVAEQEIMKKAGCLSDNQAGIQAIIDDAEIQRLFAPLHMARGLVLAISGGPDSLALMMLAARWRDLNKTEKLPQIFVASVDHALRPEASDEAQRVKDLANDLGFSAQVLVWLGEKPTQAIQEVARTARYQLLVQAAREWGASHIATAHHYDDQAETVLMRLASGSGIGGLGAMRPMAIMPGSDMDGHEPIYLSRPLLGITKERLVAFVREAGLSAVDDPSNRNMRFARVRLRQLTRERDALGLSDNRLVMLAQRCSRADSALARIAKEKFAAFSKSNAHKNQIQLAESLWLEPEEIILRCIKLALKQLADHDGPGHVPLERLERLMTVFQESRALGQELRRTLYGMIVHMDKKGVLTINREPTRYRGRRNSE